jgi:hypothetical protein
MSGLSQYQLVPNFTDRSWILWCRQESEYNALMNMNKVEQHEFMKKYFKLDLYSANLIIKQKEIGGQYQCATCNYATKHKTHFNKHNKTIKHLKLTFL